MWFGGLGRLEVCRPDGSPVPISGPARRQLLAALLCRAGSPVPAATLIDDLWGAGPPRSALNTLRTHMARLRDDLGRDVAGSLVRTEGDGYRLDIGPDDFDVTVFERLAEEAEALTDPTAAIRRYDEALALWRDEAYVEFGEASFAVGERIRLAEQRAFARERRTDLALASGSAAELVGELEQRVRAEPYRERGWEQLALALYRAGRQADALATCRRIRHVLVEDLGVDPGPGLQALEERLLRQDPELLVAAPQAVPVAPTVGRCPYLGLAGYDEHDAPLFVGRERLTSALAGRLADQSIVVVTGASGVGKSSLVRAGLVPALRAGALPGSAAWRIEVRTPADGVKPHDEERVPDLLVLDQAEELFTTLEATAHDELVARLASYIGDRDGRLVLVLRSDFYGRLADVDLLAPFAEKRAVLVGPMREDELRRALIEPAAAAGLRLEPDLVETIMEDAAGQPEPLPLLSEAMVNTWHRRKGELLTLEGYRLAGELAGALEAAAEQCYVGLGEAERSAARHLLVRMAAPSAGGWVRRPITQAALERDRVEEQALTALVAARLVVASDDRLEIAHDALLVHWPRLRDWLAERSLAADLLHHLDQAATTWRASGRQDADLYRGPRLSSAMDWRTDHGEDLAPAEEEFLDASARAATAELEAARAQTAREARGRRNLRRVAVGLAATVALALIGGGVALHERGTARSETTRAQRSAVTADARRVAALALTEPDLATSSELAVAAWRVQDSPETRNALLTVLQRTDSALWRMPFPLRTLRLFVDGDGRTAWVMDRDRYVHVVDLVGRREIGVYPIPADDVAGVTPDGQTLFVFGADHTDDPRGAGRVTALNARTGAVRHVLPVKGQEPTSGGIAPVLTSDGRWLAIPSSPGASSASVTVFSTHHLSAPTHTWHLGGAAPTSLAAGRTAMAVQSSDHTVRTFQIPGFRQVWERRVRAGDDLVALSPDGDRLAMAGRSLRLVSTAGSSAGRVISSITDPGVVAEFSPNGSELAVGQPSGAVDVFTAMTGGEVAALAGHSAPVQGVAWARAGGRAGALYSVGLDSQLVRWDLSGGSRIRQSVPHSVLPPPNETGQYDNTVIGDGPAEDGSYPHAGGHAERAWRLDLSSGAMRSWPFGLARHQYAAGASASTDGTLGLLFTWDQPTDKVQGWIWNLKTLQRVGRLALPKTGYDGFTGVIAPDDKYAVVSVSTDRMGIFALPSGRLLRTYPVKFANEPLGRFTIYPIKFDPVGGVLLDAVDEGPPKPPPPGSGRRASGDRAPQSSRIGLFDPATGKLTAQAAVGRESITAVGWSHDAKLLAIGTQDGVLQLYDTTALHLVADAGAVEGGYILTASFSPDDRMLVFGSTDGTSLWSVPTLTRIGEPLRSAAGQEGWWYAWFRTDGDIEGIAPIKPTTVPRDSLFTESGHPSTWAAQACRLAGGTLTRAEWTRYFGEVPYQNVCPSQASQ